MAIALACFELSEPNFPIFVSDVNTARSNAAVLPRFSTFKIDPSSNGEWLRPTLPLETVASSPDRKT
jgi:hypothetical protein